MEAEAHAQTLADMDLAAEMASIAPAPATEIHPLAEALSHNAFQAHKKIQHREWNIKGVSGALDEGSLVCFSNEDGLPLKVVKHATQKYWELVPTHVGLLRENEDDSPHYLAPDCVFTVLKKGEKEYGFRSWAAEGRLLQATRNAKEKPRVTNYNFNRWETWHLVGNTLQNCAFKKDLSMWNLSEVRVQVCSMVTEREMRQKSEVREIRRALLMTEEKREEMEAHLNHAVQTCQKQMEFSTQQTDELQARLAENLATNECLATEVQEYQEINKRSREAIGRLTKDRDLLEVREREARRRVDLLEERFTQERVKSRDRLKRHKERSVSETKKLKSQMESALRAAEEENEGLRKALDSIASKISQFSARNSPAPQMAASLSSDSGHFDGKSSPTAAASGAGSAEDSGSEMDFSDEDCLVYDTYPVDTTLLEDEDEEAVGEAKEAEPRAPQPLPQLAEDEILRLMGKLPEGQEEEKEYPSMIDLDPNHSASLESTDRDQGSQGPEEESEDANEARHAETEPTVADLQKSLHSLVMEQSESSSIFDNSAEEVAQDKGYEAEVGFKAAVAAPTAPMAKAGAKEVPEVDLNPLGESAGFTRTGFGGGKRVSALPVQEDDADYESEDWWNSFTMQTSLH